MRINAAVFGAAGFVFFAVAFVAMLLAVFIEMSDTASQGWFYLGALAVVATSVTFGWISLFVSERCTTR